ncbi:hypothetical protein Tco_1103711 [Tanacetum coccineum]
MKNLDAYTFGDQFFIDKPTEEESDKANMETKVESMVTFLIHQASSSVPLLSTPVIDITPPKHVSPPIQEPIFTATTTTTPITLPLPTPPQQQSTTNSELAARVTTLENKFSDLEQKSKNLDNTTQNLGSRVFEMELYDLPHKIDQKVYEVVKEAVRVALQAPLRDRFRDLPKANMKEMLHQRMFESGLYKSHPEHVALYEALEASMERAQRDEFLAEKAKEAPSSSSKQKSIPHSEQPVEDVPIPNDMDLSDSEDTDTAHLPKDWLKPVPEEDTPATLEPDWLIPPNDIPEPENNWANALASSYQDPDEYKLLRQTGNMIRPFHNNSISLQFQMEECHLLLTNQVDLVNPEGHRVVPNVSKPLPLGGPPGQVTIQIQYFFNKNLDYLVSGDKGRSLALSISKLKAAQYLDFELEELVLSLWIESERDYDISVAYADYNEYKISEADFKNLHSNDFEDLYLLHLQGQLNHLSGADKVHLFNVVNLWIRNIVIRKCVEDL